MGSLPRRLIPYSFDHMRIMGTYCTHACVWNAETKSAFSRPLNLKALLFHCSLLFYVCRVREEENESEENSEVHKRVNNVFQRRLGAYVGPSSRERVIPLLCQCISPELGKHPAEDLTQRLYHLSAHSWPMITDVCAHINTAIHWRPLACVLFE